MSRREMKTYIDYQEGGFKVENEPEEGEIVDDYDLIISSDEEFSMRQRIRELEAENEEIEQITVISRSYSDKINPSPHSLDNSRAAQVPTDVSSISSTEFITPKKRRRSKSRDHKRRHCQHQHQHQHQRHHQHQHHTRHNVQRLPLKSRFRKAHCKRRQKLFARKHQKVHSDRYMYKEVNIDTVSLEPLESSDSSSIIDCDNYSRNSLTSRKDDSYDYGKYITRDTLRLAVARNSNDSRFFPKKSCLKDKLLKQELVIPTTNTADGQNRDSIRDDVNEYNDDDDDDDDVQVIESEPDVQTVDEDSTDSMEEKELRLIALKSAVLKKHMARKMRNAEAAYSPTDFDKMLSSGILQEDNKLDDLEVVNFEEDEDSQNVCVIDSPEASPQLIMLDDQEESEQMVDCKPIDMDIANSENEDTTMGSWSKEIEATLPSYSLVPRDFANHFQYGFYMHELPPPPPGVDDYENERPPSVYHKFYNSEMQDMELDNEDLTEAQQRSDVNAKYQEKTETKESHNDKTALMSPKLGDKEEVEDEEEEALRALLLSKFQSPKNRKKPKKIARAEEHINISKENEIREHSVTDSKPKKPTEFILKEAVKRLKIHSQNDGLKGGESTDNVYNQSQKPLECKENDCESSSLLVKLRNSLNKCKKENKNDEFKEIEKQRTGSLVDRTLNCGYEFRNVETMQENKTIFPNNLEVTNIVDISDITRRLQKIKEDVLNATNKQTAKEPLTDFSETCRGENKSQQSNEKLVENVQNTEVNKPQLECINVRHNPFHNNIENTNALTTDNIKNPLGRDKNVEANFNVTTNQTTCKIMIKNNDILRLDDKEINASNNDVLLKENKANNISKNITLKNNTDTKSKNAINTERSVNILNKTIETGSELKVKSKFVNTSSVEKPATNVPQASTISAFSAFRTTKIIKPNKVINTNFDINRIQVSQTKSFTTESKASRPDSSFQSINSVDNARLITAMDQVKHMCKVAPFIINVQNSSNESSGDEWGDCDSFCRPLYDYNDNTSPLSLNLESPTFTPVRSNSPTESNTIIQKNVELETKFNEKTQKTCDHNENAKTSIKRPKKDDSDQEDRINKTPLAVRHLPAAAQSEYRRLVHRMKLLENKRKMANIDENKQETSIGKKNEYISSVSEEVSTAEKADSTSKSSLVKKVLLRNTNSNNVNSINVSESNSSKSNALRSYESLYVKIGAGIINNLDKSLKLVEEAKKAKLTKLKLENRIKELKAEMEILQSQHKEEEQKIARIYPSICTTNEVITSLKQKRLKVFKAALNLGKTLKGEEYRLNNALKERINTKSKQLATEIKVINSLKAQDIENTSKLKKANELADNKKKNPEDYKAKQISQNIINDKVVYCKEGKEHKEKTDESKSDTNSFQTSTTQFGGNTEFQNKEPNKPIKNAVQDENTCPLDNLKELETSEVNNDSEQTSALLPYISPLEHLRNIDSNIDPNGIICPYDLMGNCEDATCKYVHISPNAKT